MSNKTEYAYYFDLAVPEKFSAEKESIMVRTESTGILEKYSKFLAKVCSVFISNAATNFDSLPRFSMI